MRVILAIPFVLVFLPCTRYHTNYERVITMAGSAANARHSANHNKRRPRSLPHRLNYLSIIT